MMTIYKPAYYVLDYVKCKAQYSMNTETLKRLDTLEQMLLSVESDTMIAIDEELFKFLEL